MSLFEICEQDYHELLTRAGPVTVSEFRFARYARLVCYGTTAYNLWRSEDGYYLERLDGQGSVATFRRDLELALTWVRNHTAPPSSEPGS